MKIEMDYPQDSKYNGFDGKTHSIKPIGMYGANIDGKDLFLMAYRDISLGNISMITILERNNGKFRKVPLLNYESEAFDKLMNRIKENGDRVKIEHLPAHIDTRKTPITVEDLLKEQLNKNPVNSSEINISKQPPTPPVPPKVQAEAMIPPTKPPVNVMAENKRPTNIETYVKNSSVIYYNIEDGKYYWDKECTHRILNAPNSLGVKDGNKIHGPNCEYIIKYVSKGHEVECGKVYFDGTNYYWDKKCERKILGAPNSIGSQESTNKIRGKDGKSYQIVNVKKIYCDNGEYFYNEECTIRLPFEIESLGRIEGNTIEETDNSMYLIVNLQKNKESSNGGFRR